MQLDILVEVSLTFWPALPYRPPLIALPILLTFTPGMPACLPLQAVGRQNFGCDQGGWDFKGLTSQNVTLNGAPALHNAACPAGCRLLLSALHRMQSLRTDAIWLPGPLFPWSAAGKLLRDWEVFPLQLDDVSSMSYDSSTATSGDAASSTGTAASAGIVAFSRRRLLEAPSVVAAASAGEGKAADVPTFFRQVAGAGRVPALMDPSAVIFWMHAAGLWPLPLLRPSLLCLLTLPLVLECLCAGAGSQLTTPQPCAAAAATWPTPTWLCTAGARALPGSMGSTWAGTGPHRGPRCAEQGAKAAEQLGAVGLAVLMGVQSRARPCLLLTTTHLCSSCVGR